MPTPTAFTTPFAFTVATFSLLLFHVNTASASFGDSVAFSASVSPMYSFAALWLSVTAFGGCCTVTLQVAFRPLSVFTVMTAVPLPTPVTLPSSSTFATFLLLLLQV